MALIQDVTKPYRPETPSPELMMVVKRQVDTNMAQHMDIDILVMELIQRGITIRDLFGMYYAAEEGTRLLVAEDAELAGMASLPDEPAKTQPF